MRVMCMLTHSPKAKSIRTTERNNTNTGARAQTQRTIAVSGGDINVTATVKHHGHGGHKGRPRLLDDKERVPQAPRLRQHDERSRGQAKVKIERLGHHQRHRLCRPLPGILPLVRLPV